VPALVAALGLALLQGRLCGGASRQTAGPAAVHTVTRPHALLLEFPCHCDHLRLGTGLAMKNW